MAEETTKQQESTETPASEKKEVVVPEKFKSLVEQVETMSVLDLSELVSILEDKFGVSAAAPMMAMPAMPGAGASGEPRVVRGAKDCRRPRPVRSVSPSYRSSGFRDG